jgi:hypothetical protein
VSVLRNEYVTGLLRRMGRYANGDTGIRRWISTGFKSADTLEAEATEKLIRINEERRLRGAKPLDIPEKDASKEDLDDLDSPKRVEKS